MNGKGFQKFLVICSIFMLILSVVFSLINLYAVNNNSSDIYKIDLNITQTQNLKNDNSTWGNLEKNEFHDSVYIQLIEWKGQGTINWGLGFLASITVFFAILIEGLHKKDYEHIKSDGILALLGLIFLSSSILSVFQLATNYRYVGVLQNKLLTIPFINSTFYYLVASWWVIEIGMVLLSIIFLVYSIYVWRKNRWLLRDLLRWRFNY
jgi:hypothetical protein